MKYKIKGFPNKIVGQVRSAHFEMIIEEKSDEDMRKLLAHKDFPLYLITEGRLVIDNYSIDECGELDNFEFERIEDET